MNHNVVANELVSKNNNKTKKISVWETHIGKDKGSCKCFCCKTHEITQMNFARGHIISEHEGETLDVNNLRPACTTNPYKQDN